MVLMVFWQTTPGDYLENGQILSAKICKLWGLKLWGAKYLIEAGFEKIKVIVEVLPTNCTCHKTYLIQGNTEGKHSAATESFFPRLPQDVCCTLICLYS